MDNNSTQHLQLARQRRRTNRCQNISPKPSTIAFIKQFARAYTFEPRLYSAFGGYINN